MASLASVMADLLVTRRFKRPQSPTDEDREAIDITFLRAQAQTISDPTRFVMDSVDGMRQLNSVDPAGVARAGGQYAGCVAFFAYTGFLFGVGSRLLRRAEPLSAAFADEAASIMDARRLSLVSPDSPITADLSGAALFETMRFVPGSFDLSL